MQIVRNLEALVTTPELRAAYNAVQPKVSEFYSSLPLNEALWQAVLSYSRTEEAGALTGIRKRFLEKTMDNFRRHGAELNPEGKKRIAEIDLELTKQTIRFARERSGLHQSIRVGDHRRKPVGGSARKRASDGAGQRGFQGISGTFLALHAASPQLSGGDDLPG